MALTYEEIMAPRRARWSSETKGQAELFAQAYDMAMQIWTLREKLGLTQVELAERCGIDQNIIERIERGVTSPTDRALLRVTAELVQRCDIGQDDIKRIESDITDPADRALLRLAAVLHADVSHPARTS